jgi:hypothetical protein
VVSQNNDFRSALNLPPADCVVDDMLRDSERKQNEASLSQDERKQIIEMRKRTSQRKETQRQKSKDQAANRLVLLLPMDLKDQIIGIAKAHNVTQSQVTTFFLYEALLIYRDGKIDFENYKLPTNSPRYDWNLVHPMDRERYSRISEKKQKRNQISKFRGTP